MTRMMRIYLILTAGALAAAFVAQAFRPDIGLAGTVWGMAPGWQREIAFWNVGMIVIILGVLWKGEMAAARLITRGLIVLSVLLAANHTYGWVVAAETIGLTYSEQGGALWHVYGTLANLTAIFLGSFALISATPPLRDGPAIRSDASEKRKV